MKFNNMFKLQNIIFSTKKFNFFLLNHKLDIFNFHNRVLLINIKLIKWHVSSAEDSFFYQLSVPGTNMYKIKTHEFLINRAFFRKLKRYSLISYAFFHKNFLALKITLLNAFYYNFFVVGLQETGFTRDVISVNINSSYFDYSDLLHFFRLKSWVALQRYWKKRFYDIKSMVILAADNHLINHLDKSHFFIIDFLSNSVSIVTNSFTIYIYLYDSFFSTFFFSYVFKFKMMGSNLRFLKYLSFYYNNTKLL